MSDVRPSVCWSVGHTSFSAGVKRNPIRDYGTMMTDDFEDTTLRNDDFEDRRL